MNNSLPTIFLRNTHQPMYHKIVRKHVRSDALNIAKETKSGQVPLYIKYIDKIKVFIYINAFKIILSEV